MKEGPETLDRIEKRSRKATRLRHVAEVFAFGINGATFLISAMDGLDPATNAPKWSVAALILLGATQLGALVIALRSKQQLPERLPLWLAAMGMALSTIVVRHHHTGLPYAYATTGLIYAVLALTGPKHFARFFRRDRLQQQNED